MAVVETTDRPRGPSGLLRLYMTMWAVLAAVALVYLAALVVRPDLVAELLPASPRAEEEVVQVQRAVSRLAAEMQGVRQAVADLQRDTAHVKTTFGHRTGQDTGFGERLTAVENQVGQLTTEVNRLDVLKAAMPADSVSALKTAQRKGPPAAAVAGGAKPKNINAPQPATIETGSLGSGVTPFGSTIVVPASAPMAVYLSKGSSLDALRLVWSQMAEQHRGALENLEPRYRASGAGEGANYQLLAGPIESPDQANQICTTLRAAGVGCRVGTFAGDGL